MVIESLLFPCAADVDLHPPLAEQAVAVLGSLIAYLAVTVNDPTSRIAFVEFQSVDLTSTFFVPPLPPLLEPSSNENEEPPEPDDRAAAAITNSHS